jgi:hypothetical protein
MAIVDNLEAVYLEGYTGDLVYISDYQSLVQGFLRPDSTKTSKHWDLWEDIWKLVQPFASVKVIKGIGHPSLDDVMQGKVSLTVAVAMQLVDAAAKSGARWHCPSLEDQRNVELATGLAVIVQKKLLANRKRLEHQLCSKPASKTLHSAQGIPWKTPPLAREAGCACSRPPRGDLAGCWKCLAPVPGPAKPRQAFRVGQMGTRTSSTTSLTSLGWQAGET